MHIAAYRQQRLFLLSDSEQKCCLLHFCGGRWICCRDFELTSREWTCHRDHCTTLDYEVHSLYIHTPFNWMDLFTCTCVLFFLLKLRLKQFHDAMKDFYLHLYVPYQSVISLHHLLRLHIKTGVGVFMLTLIECLCTPQFQSHNISIALFLFSSSVAFRHWSNKYQVRVKTRFVGCVWIHNKNNNNNTVAFDIYALQSVLRAHFTDVHMTIWRYKWR